MGVQLEALAPADVSVELVSMKSLSVNDQSVKGEILQQLVREVNWFQRNEALV